MIVIQVFVLICLIIAIYFHCPYQYSVPVTAWKDLMQITIVRPWSTRAVAI